MNTGPIEFVVQSRERWILGVSILGALVSIALLTDTRWLEGGEGITQSRPRIGMLSVAINDVRRKSERTISWSPLQARDEVFELDHVFTSWDSSASVQLATGEVLWLGPETLVILSQKGEEPKVWLKKGTLKVVLGKSRKFRIESARSGATLSSSAESSRASIRLENQGAITLLADESPIQYDRPAGGGSVQIGQAVTFSSEVTSSPRIMRILIQPDAVAAGGNPRNVSDEILRLRWSASDVESNASYEIQVSETEDFERIWASGPAAAPEADIPLSAFSNRHGYARVVLKDGATGRVLDSSPVERFLLQPKNSAPTLTLPAAEALLAIPQNADSKKQEESLSIPFSWKNPGIANRYEIQIERTTGEALKWNAEVKGSLWISPPLVVGEYSWKTRALDPFPSTWSLPHRFRIAVIPAIDPPQPIFPNGKAPLLLGGPNAQITYRWGERPDAELHTIEVSRDESFKTIESRLEVRGLSVEGPDLPRGIYYWRIRAVTQDGLFTAFSAPIRFEIRNRPKLKAPLTPETEIDLEVRRPDIMEPQRSWNRVWRTFVRVLSIASAEAAPPVPSLALKWSAIEGAKNYRLEISNSPNFEREVEVFELPSSEYSWLDPPPGTWFWKVTPIDEDGEPGDTSKISTVKIRVKPPVLPERMSLSPHDSKKIRLQWSPSRRTNQYSIDISRDIGFHKIEKKFITQKPSLTLEQGIDRPGTYFWRVRPLDGARQPVGSPSKVGRIIVQGPTLQPPLEVQKKIPPVIVESEKNPSGKYQFALELKRMSYRETAMSDYSAFAVVPRGFAEFPLDFFSPALKNPLVDSVRFNAAVNFFTFASSPISSQYRLLYGDGQAFHRFQHLGPDWELGVGLGWCFQTSWVTANSFGFKNMTGPLLLFSIRNQISTRHALEAAITSRLALSGTNSPQFENREFEFVLNLFKERNFVGIRYSHLDLNFSRVLKAASQVLGVQIGAQW